MNKMIEKNKVATIDEIVPIKQNSVESTVICSNDYGAVTVYSLDQGQGLMDNISPYDTLLNVMEGHANVIINNVENHVKEGQFIIMPAHVSHAVFAEQKLRLQLTMIKS